MCSLLWKLKEKKTYLNKKKVPSGQIPSLLSQSNWQILHMIHRKEFNLLSDSVTHERSLLYKSIDSSRKWWKSGWLQALEDVLSPEFRSCSLSRVQNLFSLLSSESVESNLLNIHSTHQKITNALIASNEISRQTMIYS